MSSFSPSSPRNCFLFAISLAVVVSTCGCFVEKDNLSPTAKHEAELMAADRLFASQVAAEKPADRGEAWARWFAPSGRQIIPGQVVQGVPSVADLMAGAFSSPGYSLTWDPDIASASNDGTLGWTSGRFESRSGEPGHETVNRGRYLTIWQRQEDGSWKVAVDTGVPDPTE